MEKQLEKIYGIYPGSLEKSEKFDELNEVQLYCHIDAMSFFIWKSTHDMADGRIPEIDLSEEKYALDYMVYQTKKFGVKLAEPQSGKRIVQTESFMAWFNFYDKHFKKILSDEEWHEFQFNLIKGSDISKFMPEGNWKYYYEKEMIRSLNK